jgi:ADP-L-glycero-D-manno-heptose 6-epimerase
MSKTALITGATGFVGSALCNTLYADNWNVIAIGSKNENNPLRHKFIELNLDGISWDLIPNIDVCFHQAANNDTTDLDVENMIRSNLTAPSNLFCYLAKEKKCKQFVYASSCSIYGNKPVPYIEQLTEPNPLNPYAYSKLLFEKFAEKFAIEYNVNLVGLRYSNVYGPGEHHKGKRSSMIYQLLHKMKTNERPEIFKFGEQLRDWVYIEDVVTANILASQYKKSGIFNIGSGETMSFNEVVSVLNIELNSNLKPEYIDCPFKGAYQTHTLLDLTQSNKELGYSPKYEASKGIKKFVEEINKAKK